MVWLFRIVISWLAMTSLAAPPAISRTVIIGAEDDWYPSSGWADGKLQGLTIDVVREAFAAAG